MDGEQRPITTIHEATFLVFLLCPKEILCSRCFSMSNSIPSLFLYASIIRCCCPCSADAAPGWTSHILTKVSSNCVARSFVCLIALCLKYSSFEWPSTAPSQIGSFFSIHIFFYFCSVLFNSRFSILL